MMVLLLVFVVVVVVLNGNRSITGTMFVVLSNPCCHNGRIINTITVTVKKTIQNGRRTRHLVVVIVAMVVVIVVVSFVVASVVVPLLFSFVCLVFVQQHDKSNQWIRCLLNVPSIWLVMCTGFSLEVA